MTTQSVDSAKRPNMQELRALAADFLSSHTQCLFSTTQRDGTPQQTLVAYRFDEGEIVINCDINAAKAKNARRRERVSMAVVDGETCVVVTGSCRVYVDSSPEAAPYVARQVSRHTGVRVYIVFAPDKYRWAKLTGDEVSPSRVD